MEIAPASPAAKGISVPRTAGSSQLAPARKRPRIIVRPRFSRASSARQMPGVRAVSRSANTTRSSATARRVQSGRHAAPGRSGPASRRQSISTAPMCRQMSVKAARKTLSVASTVTHATAALRCSAGGAPGSAKLLAASNDGTTTTFAWFSTLRRRNLSRNSAPDETRRPNPARRLAGLTRCLRLR
jgi:hypothetical protein